MGKLARDRDRASAADDLVVVSGIQKAIPGEKVAPQTMTITADGGRRPPGKS